MNELVATIIAESMYAQCDVNWNEYLLLKAFIDHRKNDSALSVEDQKVIIKGQETLRKSTAGWDICCKWKDGSTSWEKLFNRKELHPIQVAIYAIAQGIEYESAFNWLVHHVLKKRNGIISIVRKRSAQYFKKTHKFGLQLTKTINEA